MTEVDIARELAEEIRTNTKLRHRLGMVEGSDSGQLDDRDANVIGLTDKEGDSWFVTVNRG